MCRLFETIRVVDGKPLHLDYHAARMNRSRQKLFGCTDLVDLEQVLRSAGRSGPGIEKCRVVYGREVCTVASEPYTPRVVRSLTLVDCDSITYEHKFVDRSCFDDLLRDVKTDDILVVKNGCITDASFASVVFHDGSRWLTPATPLLPGTARARLLQSGEIAEREIRKADLRHFRKAALINAMIGIDHGATIAMEDIV